MLSGKRLLKMNKTNPAKCFQRLVLEDLLEHYDIGIRPAVIAVRCSRFYKSLQEDPQAVMSDFPDEWAASIAREFNFRRK